jgi:hypothetical protein
MAGGVRPADYVFVGSWATKSMQRRPAVVLLADGPNRARRTGGCGMRPCTGAILALSVSHPDTLAWLAPRWEATDRLRRVPVRPGARGVGPLQL